MGKYGETAIRATELLRKGKFDSPLAAWQAAAREFFPGKLESQKKSCPKSAFLGLCEEGVVIGIEAGSYCRSADNKSYALQALRLLAIEPSLAGDGPIALWSRVMNGCEKVHNSQMDVVLTLWSARLIDGRRYS